MFCRTYRNQTLLLLLLRQLLPLQAPTPDYRLVLFIRLLIQADLGPRRRRTY